MAALPQQTDMDADELSIRAAAPVFRVRPKATPPGYYRNPPLIRLTCLRLPARPGASVDLPQIHLTAPIPRPDEPVADDNAEYDEAEYDEAEYDRAELADDGYGYDDGGYEDDGYEDDDYEDDDYEDELPDEVDDAELADTELVGGQEQAPSKRIDQPPLLLTAAIVAAVVLLGLAGVIVVRQQSGPEQTRGTIGVTQVGSDASGQATSWALANLPGTKLLADPSTQTALIGQGYPSTNVSAVTGGATQTDAKYVIVTAAVRQAGSQPGSEVATMLAEALPIAIFGNGQDRVEISQLGAMVTNLSAARQARLVAGQALARNPGLAVDPALSKAISQGRLDMRASTVLAVLASQAKVNILALPQSGPEQRAGAPVRTIQFTLAGATAAALVDNTLQALPPDMAPSYSRREADGSFQIVWLPDLALTPPAN